MRLAGAAATLTEPREPDSIRPALRARNERVDRAILQVAQRASWLRYRLSPLTLGQKTRILVADECSEQD